MGITYIHYGSNTFDPELLRERALMNISTVFAMPRKPYGLWACRDNPGFLEYYTWKDWCINEDFHTEKLKESFTFHLVDGAKILLLNATIEPISPYITPVFDGNWNTLDICKLYNDGYDGIELIHGDNYTNIHYSDIFYTWDVDCIVIWNPDVIIAD